jgi:hypothetical protein
MVLHQTLLWYTKHLESAVRIELNPAKFKEVEELLPVLLENHMHAALLLGVEAEHNLIAVLVATLDHIV